MLYHIGLYTLRLPDYQKKKVVDGMGVDEMRVDKTGVDKTGVDEMGRYHCGYSTYG